MNDGADKLSMAEAMSALADGEGDGATAAAIATAWRDDAALRARWHAYHLIGDALRSDELAGRGRDAEFLSRVRERLDGEPVVLAPRRAAERVAARAPVAAGRARRWATPAAMAAGFVMVAGAVLVMRAPAPLPSAPLALQAAPSATGVLAARQEAVVGATTATPPTAVGSSAQVAVATNAPTGRAQETAGVLLRDARLQQYFAAHQQFDGSTALGMPSAFFRNATFETPVDAAGSR